MEDFRYYGHTDFKSNTCLKKYVYICHSQIKDKDNGLVQLKDDLVNGHTKLQMVKEDLAERDGQLQMVKMNLQTAQRQNEHHDRCKVNWNRVRMRRMDFKER